MQISIRISRGRNAAKAAVRARRAPVATRQTISQLASVVDMVISRTGEDRTLGPGKTSIGAEATVKASSV